MPLCLEVGTSPAAVMSFCWEHRAACFKPEGSGAEGAVDLTWLLLLLFHKKGARVKGKEMHGPECFPHPSHPIPCWYASLIAAISWLFRVAMISIRVLSSVPAPCKRASPGLHPVHAAKPALSVHAEANGITMTPTSTAFLSCLASYCAGVSMSPRISLARLPDSSDFRSASRSCKSNGMFGVPAPSAGTVQCSSREKCVEGGSLEGPSRIYCSKEMTLRREGHWQSNGSGQEKPVVPCHSEPCRPSESAASGHCSSV